MYCIKLLNMRKPTLPVSEDSSWINLSFSWFFSGNGLHFSSTVVWRFSEPARWRAFVDPKFCFEPLRLDLDPRFDLESARFVCEQCLLSSDLDVSLRIRWRSLAAEKHMHYMYTALHNNGK